jgi:amino acid adenylation domain-containing protein
MITNVLDYLDASAARFPDKIAFGDDKTTLTFSQLRDKARRSGTYLAGRIAPNSPVAVFMEKTPDCLAAFFGAVSAGCFYVPLDTKMPADRVRLIFDTLQPAFVFYDEKNAEAAQAVAGNAQTALFSAACETEADEAVLEGIRQAHVDTDLLYVLFTSGSTGVPKGVTISHRCMIDYADWLHEALDIDENAVLGNQAPFVFDNSTLDIYSTLKNGATTWIIPKKCFSFHKTMMQFLAQHEINTIFFVPSALIAIANSGILDVTQPTSLERVYFCGEVMPNRQLNQWRRALPNAKFCNMYGPTEITDVCAYYVVDRPFEDDEPLPIGKACRNTRILILNDENKPVAPGEQGELCVLGTCLSLGYYNNPAQTEKAFVQNPLNTAFTERMYRTGDLAKYNDRGEIMFLGRKDFQIKHQGCYRIELGEIETALLAVASVSNGCCLFDAEKDEIVCVYMGTEDQNALAKQLKEKLPSYMMPNRYVQLERLPMTINDKIDRVTLKKTYIG